VTHSLLISDLHLSGARPESAARFFRFLDEQAAQAQALYVLGDLFEYWIGDDALAATEGDPLAASVASALAALPRRGVRLYVMHGNRDFLMGDGFARAAHAKLIDDPIVVELGGIPTLLMHGDTLCTDDTDYQAWRRTCRAPQWQQEFLAKPLAERRSIGEDLRETSRSMARAKSPEIMDVTSQAVRDAFRSHGVVRLIHGHTHRPARHALEVDGRQCERWVLPDWYGTGGYLEVVGAQPRLVLF
jgi:UDP-2,3-diacylglucosamine hydrolase